MNRALSTADGAPRVDSPLARLWNLLANIDKRLLLIIAVTLTVAFSFWLGSRIPNLNEKAMMGGDTELEVLGFDQVLEIQEGDGFVKRVVYTTVNWVDTNKRGMTFGVILAACLMSLLSLFRTKSFKNGFANAFMGTLIGTPLGVCVNCAAPIAKGLHSGGTRLETTLSAMISSPTMNLIVLTMLFALFPGYMVLTKLGLTLAFILIGIPILSRILFTQKQLEQLSATVPDEDGAACELPANGMMQSCDINISNSWKESIVWLFKSLTQNFWYIVKTTVPLMFLAGFLGAFAMIAIPWDAVMDFLPRGVGPVHTLTVMAILTTLGTFLPVPIAFDVVLVTVLMASGMPVKYAMVLLFTLGIFSVYSFSIVWRYISKRVAVMLYLSVMAMGMVAGVVAHYASLWDEARQREAMYSVFFEGAELVERPVVDAIPGEDDMALVASIRASGISPEARITADDAGVSVARIPFAPRTGKPGEYFERVDAKAFGIDEESPFSLLRHLPPRYWGRGVASGDIHNDGWPDLLIAADNLTVKGVSLYANDSGKGFIKQRVDVPALKDLEVVNAALVDINDDGWLDIFVSAYRGGNYIVYNNEGRFSGQEAHALPEHSSILAAAVSFGDIDTDGDLDIVLGNWGLGYFREIMPGEPAVARNVILLQEDGEFSVAPLKEYPGETLSTLLTDLNDDGFLDLIIGNDFSASDVYYYGDGTGEFTEITAADAIIPHTTDSTMSIASADINNDLIPELYLAQITTGIGAGFAEEMQPSETVCDDFKNKDALRQCLDQLTLNEQVDKSRNKRDAVSCLAIEDPLLLEDCMVLHVLWSAWMLEEQEFCSMIPNRADGIGQLCNDMFAEHVPPPKSEKENAIQQITSSNVLLVDEGGPGYSDRARDLGLKVTGWSWNAKFADLDNDEWQDLYVANGMFQRSNRESNFFFHNKAGQGFDHSTAEFGLTDFRATGGYSYIDFDNDGDLDIASIPVNGPVRMFVNNSVGGNSVMFELRDSEGNRFGIGSKIVISYGDEDAPRQQMRELQAGGGFISFDAPIAHFGLGDAEQVNEVEIRWSTGGTTRLQGPFAAGARYVVERADAVKLASADSKVSAE
jgi:uncharacterized membrane protein YraQ (UPF0718 family)